MPAPNARDLLRPVEIALAFTQSILGPLAVLDVGGREVPARDASLLVAQRIVTEQKPPMRSILSPYPCFELVRKVACGSDVHISRQPFPVVRMEKPKRIRDTPPFLKRYAEVIERRPVGIESAPVGFEFSD